MLFLDENLEDHPFFFFNTGFLLGSLLDLEVKIFPSVDQ